LLFACASFDRSDRDALNPALPRAHTVAAWCESPLFARRHRMRTPRACAAGGAFTVTDPISDVPCRLAGTAGCRFHTDRQLPRRTHLLAQEEARLGSPVQPEPLRRTPGKGSTLNDPRRLQSYPRIDELAPADRASRAILIDFTLHSRTVSPYRHLRSRQRCQGFLRACLPSTSCLSAHR